jgi:anti-sigma factor RsiW
MSGSNDRTEDDVRHRTMMGLLGAYADDEIAGNVKSEVESHLQRCDECRRELRIQVALRARLHTEERAAPPAAMMERLEAHLGSLGAEAFGAHSVPTHSSASRIADLEPTSPTLRSSRIRSIVTWGGWLIAASLAAFWIVGKPRSSPQNMAGMTMGPPIPVLVDSVPEPIADAALKDFRRVAAADLPEGPHLARVEADVPFSVPALRSAHMRLIGSWTTEIAGERAAALAYRCHDRLVVQYVIAEHVFFRPPRVRQAIATEGVYATGDGDIHAVAWPGTDNGSFLVGEFPASVLAAMRL